MEKKNLSQFLRKRKPFLRAGTLFELNAEEKSFRSASAGEAEDQHEKTPFLQQQINAILCEERVRLPGILRTASGNKEVEVYI